MNSIKSGYYSQVFLCSVLLFVALPLFGQSTSTGTVVGQVTDATDAPVAGARVSLIDHTTGTTKETTTNDAGRYVFVHVNSGRYDIKVETTGIAAARFAKLEVSPPPQSTGS